MYSSDTVTERGRLAARLPYWALREHRLARMAARGESRAFEAMFARYHGELYHYCRAILGEPDEANDALQNTMAVAIRHLPSIERRKSLRGWLYRVAHNEAVSMLRRRPLPLDPVDLPEGVGSSAEASFEERERLRRLVDDLRDLPDRQRGAIVMRELSDLSYCQIATAMECSEAGARQLVYEARESLRAVELGRNLECESARRAISTGDGRVFRGRRVRAHLAVCEPCRDYRAAIGRRRNDLTALFPPLVPAAASGALASLLGGLGESGAGGVTVGGAGAKAASIASVVVLGAGTAGVGGGLESPFGPGGGPTPAAPAPRSAPAPHPSIDISQPGGRMIAAKAGLDDARRPAQVRSNPGRAGAKAHPVGPPSTPPGATHSSSAAEPASSASAASPSQASGQGLARAAVAQAAPHGASGAAAGTPVVPNSQAEGNPAPPGQSSKQP